MASPPGLEERSSDDIASGTVKQIEAADSRRGSNKPQLRDRRRSSRLLSLGQQAGPRDDGKVELTEEDAWEATGFAFPTWKKWMILTVIFSVQSSMNVSSLAHQCSAER